MNKLCVNCGSSEIYEEGIYCNTLGRFVGRSSEQKCLLKETELNNKCLDDELYDIYIQDGKQIIESLREIYEKGRADMLDEVIKKLAENEDTMLSDKQYYTLMELKE